MFKNVYIHMNIDKPEILFIKATDNGPVWAAWK